MSNLDQSMNIPRLERQTVLVRSIRYVDDPLPLPRLPPLPSVFVEPPVAPSSFVIIVDGVIDKLTANVPSGGRILWANSPQFPASFWIKLRNLPDLNQRFFDTMRDFNITIVFSRLTPGSAEIDEKQPCW